MVDLKELKEIALSNVMDPDSEYFFRFVCRWYSKTFHTPLHEVIKLNPYIIYLNYFEDGYSQMEEEDRIEDMYKAINPDYDKEEEESVQNFIELIEQEEENKRRAKTLKDKLIENFEQTTSPQSPPVEPPPVQVVRTYNDDDSDM